MNAFHSTNLFCCFSRYQAPANSIAPPSVYKSHTTHDSSIRSDEGLMLETSAFESLYSGQFTLSTQLIKPNYPEFIHSVMITVICHPLQTLLPGSSYCVTHFPFLSQVIHSDPFTAKNIYLLSITPLHTRKLILDSYHKCWC